jgi:hypothetical protein
MLIRRFLYLTTGLFLFTGGTAGAQEPGKAGLTMGFPGSIGLIWHATDKVAIRPDFTFTRSTLDGTGSSSTWSFGTNISALFYMRKYENVRTYFSPRFSYSRTSSTFDVFLPSQTAIADLTTTTSGTGGGGLFGAQYSPGARFSVFGEAGLSFSHRSTGPVSGTPSSTKVKGNGWGTTAGVGVVFYF